MSSNSPIPEEARPFVVEVVERDLRDRSYGSDAIAQMRDQVTRNGRWGTCAECPDATGATYPARHRTEVFPERCPNTDRYDHWLGTDIVAVYAHAKSLYDLAEHMKAHRDLVASALEKAEAELSDAWAAFSPNVRDAGVTLAEAIWAGHREFEDKERQHAETRATIDRLKAKFASVRAEAKNCSACGHAPAIGRCEACWAAEVPRG